LEITPYAARERGILSRDTTRCATGCTNCLDESRRRPGDVSLPAWQFNKGLAIDVAVICPVAPSHVKEEVPCEAYAANQKHARYDPGFVDSRYDFAAMVFETSGAPQADYPNGEQARVCRELCLCWSCVGPFRMCYSVRGCPIYPHP